jgi:regulation of enolase protein 1 (concanavalin A-like superfamily)
MKALLTTALLITTCLRLGAQELFHDDFKGKLGEGWSWVREHSGFWRVTDRGLEVRIEPGNMWGPKNDARNLLARLAPERTHSEIEITVTVENNPTHQYEQSDLVWYYDDSNMVKIGQELVDGKLSVVMGREEGDKTRTLAIIPIASTTVRLRLVAKGNEIRGQYRIPGESDWHNAGQCATPAPTNNVAKISLQFYQGSEAAEHWARVTDFSVRAVPITPVATPAQGRAGTLVPAKARMACAPTT